MPDNMYMLGGTQYDPASPESRTAMQVYTGEWNEFRNAIASYNSGAGPKPTEEELRKYYSIGAGREGEKYFNEMVAFMIANDLRGPTPPAPPAESYPDTAGGGYIK